ncbi:MAG: DUF993 family protein [Trebonia sp.]
MSATLTLPGGTQPLTVERPPWPAAHRPAGTRRAYAAAHVAARSDGEIDWESTLAFREYLWSQGFGVAEAMDTAQRGMGLTWAQARELIERTAARATETGGLLACGAGTDQLSDGAGLAQVSAAYEEQIIAVEAAGATVVLMASRALVAAARSAQDFRDVYRHLLRGVRRPVILHWLGEIFDPALTGYWGADSFEQAAATVLEIIADAGAKVDGIKLSLLDAGKEVWLRHQLPDGVRMYTGDDFGYAELIEGDEQGHSDALLGALAAITAPAAEALAALDAGDNARYRSLIEPTVPLSRTLFEAPTYEYKAGIAFIAWLNGLQPEFAMVDGFERRRSDEHLIRVFELAAACGALIEPELAVERMSQHLRIASAV